MTTTRPAKHDTAKAVLLLIVLTISIALIVSLLFVFVFGLMGIQPS